MRWDNFRGSDNVEDRRGSRAAKGGLGIGTMIVLGFVGWYLGINPMYLISGAEMISQATTSHSESGVVGTPDDEMGRFAGKILGNTEDVWKKVFPEQIGKTYVPTEMVLFSNATQSACGFAQAAMGPFYCPLDHKVYVDLTFFQMMKQQFGASGDFSYAYVIAHEVGHHVESQLGILQQVQNRQRVVGQGEANKLSVGVELMADCLAGVWAHHSDAQYRSLEKGDIEEALKTAQAIGDDMLQKRSQGYVVPDSFTHGTSEQRAHWLAVGLKTGRIETCNTFAQ